MRIERQPNSVFISHSGLTIFANKTVNGYVVKVTERLEDGSWRTVKETDVSANDFRQWVYLLGELQR